MKKIKNVLFASLCVGLLFLSACKDEPTTPEPTPVAKTCTIATASSGADVYTYTFENGKLVKLVDKYQSGTDTYNLIYTGGQLTEITDGEVSYKISYSGSKVAKMVYSADGTIEEEYVFTVNASNKIEKIESYFVDGSEKLLYRSNTYTFTGDNCTKMVVSQDIDDDGLLDAEYDITYSLTAFDTKLNPEYLLPTSFMHFDNPMYFCKNNMTAGTEGAVSELTTISATYTYDVNGNPTQRSFKYGTSLDVTTFTYDCK